MALTAYNKKRNFKNTPEPKGVRAKITKKAKQPHKEKQKEKEEKEVRVAMGGLRFVIQKHDASHLHYDLRLEMEGVMKSFAVPKGPSLDPSVKRLAMIVEDHPIAYNSFEGHIPEGNYGAGDVIVWDNGIYHAYDNKNKAAGEKELLAGLEKGSIKFFLKGKKVKGLFALVRFKGKFYGKEHKANEWLLIKEADEYVSTLDPTRDAHSVISKRELIGRKEQRISPNALTKSRSKDMNTKSKLKSKINAERINPYPDLSPMLATATDSAFDDDAWIFEIKYDGYRALAETGIADIKLYSRNHVSFKEHYPSIVSELRRVKEHALFDGEIIAYDKQGKASFGEMQHARESGAQLEYVIFDLLFLDGKDLTHLPLIERKSALEKLIKKYPELTFSLHIEREGKEFYQGAVKHDLEGIIAKRKDSIYSPGKRTLAWLKIKNHKSDEAVIVGFTKPRQSRKYFGSLIFAQYKEDKLVFVGHAGAGFTEATLKQLYIKMRPLAQKHTSLDGAPKKILNDRTITWIKPRLVAALRFTEWTKDGAMRHPVYLGLHEDKLSAGVIKEKVVTKEMAVAHIESAKDRTPQGEPFEFSNPDKIFFPKLGLTKRDLVAYYEKISETMLPHLIGRPESLNRHPNGVGGKSFFQKNITFKTPDFVETYAHFSRSTQENVNYLVCNNKETLLYMASLGCIEINPWNSRLSSLDNPDFYIIDLDPSDKNTFEEVIRVAQEVKKVLDISCEKSYVKTSGKSGIHVCIPLSAKYHYQEVRNFALLIVRIVHKRLPDLTSIERSPLKRKDKIYLDHLQNSEGQTIAAPYSLRPTEEATVSAPLHWKEVKKGLTPKKFTYKTIFARLKKYGDIWQPMLTESVDLHAALICLEKELNAS